MKILGNPEDYIAGLWRKTILLDMLWETSNGVPLKEYRAPTWSWASLNGPITYHDVIHSHFHREKYCKVLARVVDISIQHMTLDPYAEVIGGKIKISGLLATLHVERKQGYTQSFKNIKTYVNSYHFGSNGNARFKFDIGFGRLSGINTPEIMGPDMRLHVLPIVRTLNITKPLFFCLVLKPTREEKGIFKRVGLLQLESMEENPTWFDIEQKRKERDYKGKVKRDWLEYQEFDGENYTITII